MRLLQIRSVELAMGLGLSPNALAWDGRLILGVLAHCGFALNPQ
jgi:hypothetical protein